LKIFADHVDIGTKAEIAEGLKCGQEGQSAYSPFPLNDFNGEFEQMRFSMNFFVQEFSRCFDYGIY
jgi:hypothetical protein